MQDSPTTHRPNSPSGMFARIPGMAFSLGVVTLALPCGCSQETRPVRPTLFSVSSPTRVDFGRAGGAIGVQQEFEAIEGLDESTPSPAELSVASSFGNGAAITVSVFATSSGSLANLGWRDREGLAGGPLADKSQLLSDFVMAYTAYGADALNLRLAGLARGRYTMTTYHHDTAYQDHGAITVYVSDAYGEASVASGVVQSTGTSPTSISSLQFDFTADGVNPVIVRFAETQAAILNGFELTRSAPR